MDNVNDVLLDRLLKLTAEKAADEEHARWSKRADMIGETLRAILGDKAAELSLLPWEETVVALERKAKAYKEAARDVLSLSEQNVELAVKLSNCRKAVKELQLEVIGMRTGAVEAMTPAKDGAAARAQYDMANVISGRLLSILEESK